MEQSEKHIATRYQRGKEYFFQNMGKPHLFKCSPGFVGGRCGGGHHFAAVQFCGKEYCKDCGRDGSPIHQRRTSRVWSKAKDWQKMGYLVVTVPEYMRPFFLEAEILKDFRFKLLRKLKKDYNIGAGAARWHWFGDCENCSGIGCKFCEDTGSGDYWNPHLNILFNTERGFIKNLKEYLCSIKSWMRLYFKKIIKNNIKDLTNGCSEEEETQVNYLLELLTNLEKENFVINYSYVEDDKSKMNRVKYVFRSTFRRYSKDIKTLLHNFRNSIRWGWKKGEKEIDENTEDAVLCPICEKKGVKHFVRWGLIEKHDKNNLLFKIKNDDNQPTKQNAAIKRESTLYGVYRGNRGSDMFSVGTMGNVSAKPNRKAECDRYGHSTNL